MKLYHLIILGIVLLIVGCMGGCAMLDGGLHYSEGHREGRLQKFSKKGYIWKTYEGELALPGWQKTEGENPTMSNVWGFTASDPAIIEEIKKLHADEEVRLYYDQYILVPPWKGDTQYFITKVERIK